TSPADALGPRLDRNSSGVGSGTHRNGNGNIIAIHHTTRYLYVDLIQTWEPWSKTGVQHFRGDAPNGHRGQRWRLVKNTAIGGRSHARRQRLPIGVAIGCG